MRGKNYVNIIKNPRFYLHRPKRGKQKIKIMKTIKITD